MPSEPVLVTHTSDTQGLLVGLQEGTATLRKHTLQGERQIRKQGVKPSPPPAAGTPRKECPFGGFPPPGRCSCSAAGGEGKRFQTVISSSSGSQRRPHHHLLRPNPVPSPALSGSRPNPTGMQPVTCAAAAADVPLPPRPKETQRHLALTQLQKSQEKKRLHCRTSAPKSRRGRARALTSRRERSKWSGKSLATSFRTAWVPQKTRRQRSPSSLLPLCLCNSLPRRLWPHPLLQHEVIASQSLRARQKSPGADWLPTPPLPLPTSLTEHPRSCSGPRRRKPPFGGEGPKSQIRNRCVILVGKPVLFLGLPFPLRETSSAPPSFNHRYTNELPLPSQHTVPRRGILPRC